MTFRSNYHKVYKSLAEEGFHIITDFFCQRGVSQKRELQQTIGKLSGFWLISQTVPNNIQNIWWSISNLLLFEEEAIVVFFDYVFKAKVLISG